MRKQQVPDADERAELVRRADKLISLLRKGIGGAYGLGGELPAFRPEQLSDEAKRILPDDLVDHTAYQVAQYQGPLLIEWAENPETEGQPVPSQCRDVMQLMEQMPEDELEG